MSRNVSRNVGTMAEGGQPPRAENQGSEHVTIRPVAVPGDRHSAHCATCDYPPAAHANTPLRDAPLPRARSEPLSQQWRKSEHQVGDQWTELNLSDGRSGLAATMS